MKVPVLVLPMESGSGFRGSLGAPFNVSAEGLTADEVIDKLQSMARQQTIPSGEVHWIDILAATDVPQSPSEPRFQIGQGLNPDDEVVKGWLAAMNENRRRDDDEDRQRIEEEDREKARQAS